MFVAQEKIINEYFRKFLKYSIPNSVFNKNIVSCWKYYFGLGSYIVVGKIQKSNPSKKCHKSEKPFFQKTTL